MTRILPRRCGGRIAQLLLLACLLLLASHQLASAQDVRIDLGEEGSFTLRSIQLFALITVLSLAPGIAIMVTCFPFMITVLSILRQAIGVQQAPPNMMIVSLALFLTWFVMEPVFQEAWTTALRPALDGEIDAETAFRAGVEPFRTFMIGRTNPDTLTLLADASGRPPVVDPQGASLGVLVPGFLLSEIQRGFEVGFLVFLPFLIIDLVIAAILMSMGMMMVPPVVVSLPFKLAFFVLADGWSLLAGALIRGYGP